MPTAFLERRYPTGLEADFTACWWEQRGAGLSFDPHAPSDGVTIDQLVADTVAVTDHLRERFGQERIYLMGHSWGSFLGIQAAARAPGLFHAYIGVAQVSNQLLSEKQAWDHLLAEFRRRGDSRMVARLEAAAFDLAVPLPDAWMKLRDAAMHRLGVGTTHDMRSVLTGVFLPVWFDREYTLRERLAIWRGKWSPHSRRMWNEMLATDLTRSLPKLDLPVYFLHGRHDWTVSYTGARDYLRNLIAPVKGFYTYDDSAHSPIFEEP
jgi:pimeloyl-ACP methyl ester carboxylesterase